MIRKIEAVIALVPDAEVSVDANDVVTWHKPNVSPVTEEEIQAKLAELQAEYNAQAYARSRQAEYPPWDEQLDHIYHNGVASWKANMVKPVKDKYPKPG